MIVYGVQPVLEALRARRVRRVRVARRQDVRLTAILAEAGAAGVPILEVAPGALDAEMGGHVHQGVAAELTALPSLSLDALVAVRRPALLVVLDGVEDPQNLGAILRVTDAAGANGLVRQTRHAAPLSPAAAKASAGAMATVPTTTVVNIARALEELKGLGVWVVGLAPDAGLAYDAIDWRVPTALVLGSEGAGLRRLVRDRCDWLVSIPMAGAVASLNVSTAAAVALFEAVRQRRVEAATPPADGSRRPPPNDGSRLDDGLT